MKKLAALSLLCFLMIFSLIPFVPVASAAKTIVVPDDYATITEAISNAQNGDVINVRSGIYEESVFEINHGITLRGQNVQNTMVRLTSPLVNYTNVLGTITQVPSPTIKINADNVQISGLTITLNGDITGTSNNLQLTSNIITTPQNIHLNGNGFDIQRNTINAYEWRQTGDNLNLQNNDLNLAQNGFISTGNNYNLQSNNLDGALHLTTSYSTIEDNIYDVMLIRYGDQNTIHHNSGEISLGNSHYSCSNNIVTDNLIVGPSVWGIWIGSDANNNQFSGNYIADQGYSPFEAESLSGVIFCNNHEGVIGTGNTFSGNAFVNCIDNVKFYDALLAGGNFWDNNGVGNYWSDYNGTDQDGDGVGDTPYVINQLNSDAYPLTASIEAPTVTVAAPIYDAPIDLGEPKPTPQPTVIPQQTQPASANTPTASKVAPEFTAAEAQIVPELSIFVIIILVAILVPFVVLVRKNRTH